jgi:hypothetical protein
VNWKNQQYLEKSHNNLPVHEINKVTAGIT